MGELSNFKVCSKNCLPQQNKFSSNVPHIHIQECCVFKKVNWYMILRGGKGFLGGQKAYLSKEGFENWTKPHTLRGSTCSVKYSNFKFSLSFWKFSFNLHIIVWRKGGLFTSAVYKKRYFSRWHLSANGISSTHTDAIDR